MSALEHLVNGHFGALSLPGDVRHRLIAVIAGLQNLPLMVREILKTVAQRLMAVIAGQRALGRDISERLQGRLVQRHRQPGLETPPLEREQAGKPKPPRDKRAGPLVIAEFQPQPARQFLHQIVGRMPVMHQRQQETLECRLAGDKQAGKLQL